MKAGGIKSKEAKRQVLGIEKGEFLAALFNNCTVVYNDSQHIEMTVRVKANLKVKDAETQAEVLEKKIDGATDADNEQDPQTGESQKMKWMDKRDNEKSEVVFYNQIISNANEVGRMAKEGLVETAKLRETLDKEMDDLDKHRLPYELRVD